METRDQGVVRVHPGEGETLWVLGDFVAFEADGESTSLSFFEGVVPPEGGAPPHIHHQQEEAFYVLEGTFSFLSGDKTISVRNASQVQEYGCRKRQGFGG